MKRFFQVLVLLLTLVSMVQAVASAKNNGSSKNDSANAGSHSDGPGI